MPIYVISSSGVTGCTLHFVETALRYNKESFNKMCDSFMELAGERALQKAKSKKFPSVYVPDVIASLVEVLQEKNIAQPVELVSSTYFSSEPLDPDIEPASIDCISAHMSAGLLEKIYEVNHKTENMLLEEYDAEK